jgi:hypothetical protein
LQSILWGDFSRDRSEQIAKYSRDMSALLQSMHEMLSPNIHRKVTPSLDV